MGFTVKKAIETISLLPFIESRENGFLLDIPASDQTGDVFQGYSYPFLLADKEQNFSIIVKGGLKIAPSAPFKPLFLLVQRDYYPIAPDDLAPFTNTTVDRIWHDTILFYTSDKAVFTVPDQLTRDSRIIPFESLFFCKKTNTFFHPPCPVCGGKLTLCKDDELLIQQALPPYSTSLKRYLYCPGCYASGNGSVFYQFSRSSDDRVFTKDRFDLIRDFGRLKGAVTGNFPCPECPDHAACYLTGEKAASHIGFFSFYPFHMMFFDAAPIKAIDFIPLMSGAALDEIAGSANGMSLLKECLTGQDGHGFFFKDDERFYLEVLFLKLSFFEQFIYALDARIGKVPSPFMNLSVRSLWIRPGAEGSLPPFFWNFKLRVIDLISNSPKNYIHSSLEQNNCLQFMASLWFYLFFVNRRQDQGAVYDAMGQWVKKEAKNLPLSHYDDLVKKFPTLAMENCLWNPDEISVPHKWHEFGLRIIETGIDLLDARKEQGLSLCLYQAATKISALKQDIKEALFPKEQAEAVSLKPGVKPFVDQGPSQVENQAVATILKKLKACWELKDMAAPDLDEDVLETVVLSSRDSKPSMDFNDAAEKTRILLQPENIPGRETGFEEMEKTMILSPKENIPGDRKVWIEPHELEKTVVITPKK